MAKGVPHALSGRPPKKPIIRPSRKARPAPEPKKVKASKPEPVKVKEEPKKVVAPKPEPVKVKEEPKKKETPIHLLEGSVSDLKEALDTGDFDAHLDALFDAEKAGKGRKTALEALNERMD